MISQTRLKILPNLFGSMKHLSISPLPKEKEKRKAFLTSLYYTCAFTSQTQNLAFLQKLISMHDKPIKVVKKEAKKSLLTKPIRWKIL